MTDFLSGFWNYGVVFLLVLTVVVFVHEMGHFLVARWNGVRVDVFSIGFGREIWGWTSPKTGTRWRISLLPLGGYVKMFGESEFDDKAEPLTPEEQAVSFHHKRVGQRAAIVLAGPLANFVFGIGLLALMFLVFGQATMPPVVGSVIAGSAAEEAGFRPGDRILSIRGDAITGFQDIQLIVPLYIGEKLDFIVLRDGKELALSAQPRVTEIPDRFGNVRRTPFLGIGAPKVAPEIIQHGLTSAVVTAVKETGTIISATFTGLGQMISGARESTELGGPLRIAQGAGQAAQLGVGSVAFFVILLSINLGLINLFPVPMLDGGHLAFYAVEAVLGRPLGVRAQEYGFRVGLFLVLALMLFATRNDLIELKVWDFFRGLTS